jgi:hypothetical protein
MIHAVTLSAGTRKEAEAFIRHTEEWEQQFPNKPVSYILNAVGVILYGEDLPEYRTAEAPAYRLTFLFEDAGDAVLFKLRFNNHHGQGTS